MEDILTFETLEEAEKAGLFKTSDAAEVQEHCSGEVYTAALYSFRGCTYALASDVGGGFVFTRCTHEPGSNRSGDPFTWKEVPHL